MPDPSTLFRAIPSTDKSLDALARALGGRQDEDAKAILDAPHALLREAVSAYWDNMRLRVRKGLVTDPAFLSLETRLSHLIRHVARYIAPRLQKVINATGVVIHTNSGRSTLAPEARQALELAASNYTNLELDTQTGGRGSRNSLLTHLLRTLTGAEDALVVNNNAAAVLLVMDTFCKGREAVISRGELVEIGGSFRIPDVMSATGVHLREVGTTNRTHLKDYAAAIGEETAAIVRVHTSNFRVIGFHKAVGTEELANLAHEHGLILVNDLGSGSLTDFVAAGLPGEPTVQEAVAKGSDLVLFSGDKLLGGPQAGLIVGKNDLVARLRQNPLLRALRCDKLCYAALEATLRLYLDPERARKTVPTVARILASKDEIGARAQRLAELLREHAGDACEVSLVDGNSRCGGGAFPEYPLPTVLCAIHPKEGTPEDMRKRFLRMRPILIGRIEDNAFQLDARTLEDEDFATITHLVERALRDPHKDIAG